MNRTALLYLGLWGYWLSVSISPIRADEGYVPSYVASPSGSAKVAPASTPAVSCSVKVVRGADAVAPAEVSFDADGLVGSQSVGQFSFDFGDGTTLTASDTVKHRYSQAGTYTVTVRPLVDKVTHEATCTSQVRLQAAPLTATKVECTSLTIVSTTSLTASESATIQVRGYDGRGTVQGYRLQAGEQQWESPTGNFEVTFDQPSTYILQGFVKDTEGNYVGGDRACRKEVRVRAAGITTQPETGPSLGYWLGLIGLSVAWLGVEVWHRFNRPTTNS